MDILYEDNHLLAVNKPVGMLSQGDDTGDQSVVDWVTEYIRVTYSKPGNVYVGLLHRLDRPAQGVLLLAKTSKAAARVSKMFQQKVPEKTYLIVTERIPQPANGMLIHHLKKIAGKNIMKAFKKPVHASKEAKLEYQVIQKVGSRALVEVKLHTGRRHQIRAQFGAIGCPIVGDVKYGKTDFLPDKSIALQAASLGIPHPVKKDFFEMRAPFPAGSPWDVFNKL